jgi:hypothetical protein
MVIATCLVPGLLYIHIFSYDLILQLDFAKLVLLSFGFSIPFLISNTLVILSMDNALGGNGKGLFERLREKESKFLPFLITMSLILFFLALLGWFCLKLYGWEISYILPLIQDGTVQEFWVVYLFIVTVAIAFYEILFRIKKRRKKRYSLRTLKKNIGVSS